MGGPWDHEAALDSGATVDLSQGLEAGEGEGLGVEDELRPRGPGADRTCLVQAFLCEVSPGLYRQAIPYISPPVFPAGTDRAVLVDAGGLILLVKGICL